MRTARSALGLRGVPLAAGAPRLRRLGSRMGLAQDGGLLLGLVLLSGFFTLTSGSFLTQSNLLVILLQVAVVGIIGVPAAMLVVSGYVDLSVGSVAVLSSAIFGQLASVAHAPLAISILAALLAGALWGLLNGVLIAYLGFSPIIVTLGGFAGARGLARFIAHDQTRFGFGHAFGYLGNGSILGVPVPGMIFLLVLLAGGYVWYQMAAGRHLMAIGADKEAARSLGVSIRRLPCVVYVVSGLAAGLGGLILTSQLDGASLSIGQGLELEVLTAVLLGGVAFTGGRGSLFGVVLGVLFIGVLDDGLILINVGPYVADMAVGLVLAIAAGIDIIYQRLERIPPPMTDEAPTNSRGGDGS
jgi:ribose/xylose/arabinose/galactoside ABC-type transport system permease subunit